MGTEREGEKVHFLCLFLTRTHFGPQGLPMELPGHFFKISAQFGPRFCNSFHDFGEICLQQMQSFMCRFTVVGAIFVGWGQAQWRGWAQPSR